MAKRLERLRTFLGDRSTYDAVSQCSRCGYCEQACPTYLASGNESLSPRGRNQLVRLLLEGKLADPSSAAEALSSCLLCGACASVCPAQVPTADIVLEGRRALRGEAPAAVRGFARLLLERPGVVAVLLRWAYRLKRWGVAAVAARLGILRLLGLGALEEAQAHLEEAPKRLLRERLDEDGDLQETPEAAWLYFPACGPAYVLPRVGVATVSVLKKSRGPGGWLDAPCCGLLSFNYGDLESARDFARANVERLERSPATEAPVVVDCSSCAAHLKSYPQLFLGNDAWLKRAERFSARVKDVVELLPNVSSETPTATLHDACRARNGQGLWREPRAAMKACCGEGYRELPEAEQCCGGAGAFALVHPELSEDLLKRKIGRIASVGAAVTAASSTSCLLQLARGLKKYYPEGKAAHVSEVVWAAMERVDG